MQFTSVQWNIGGGKIRKPDADISNDGVYGQDGIDYIIDRLRLYNPDVVTLQESHAKSGNIQAEKISQALGFDHWTNNKYNDSHVEEGQDLCQSIISRYPLSKHEFHFFTNPHLETVYEPTGALWHSHDKGGTSVELDVGGTNVTLLTLHLIPFRIFCDPLGQEAATIRHEVAEFLNVPADHVLAQGDFNYDEPSLAKFVDVGIIHLQEAIQTTPTTPQGRWYDHVLYRGIELASTTVKDDVLTDHYPIVSVFEL